MNKIDRAEIRMRKMVKFETLLDDELTFRELSEVFDVPFRTVQKAGARLIRVQKLTPSDRIKLHKKARTYRVLKKARDFYGVRRTARTLRVNTRKLVELREAIKNER